MTGLVLASLFWIGAGEYTPFFKEKKTSTAELATPPSPVKVPGFWMDPDPIKVRDYLKFIKKSPKWRRSQVSRIFADSAYLSDWMSDLKPGPKSKLEEPVTQVSWFSARAFCEERKMDLPTVAEWERAASVALLKKKELRGLDGSHWEWTLDFNSVLLDGDGRSQNSEDQSQFCGGGVGSAKDPSDYQGFMRYAFRSSLKGNYTVKNLGFRCVKRGTSP